MRSKPGSFKMYFFFIKILVCGLVILSFASPAASEIKKNDTAPRITLRDMNNKLVFVSDDIKNKPVILSFFFTACLPCKKEIPELEKLYSSYSNKVKIYLISTDTAGADVVRPYIESHKITIPVLLDKYSDAAASYGIDKYPSMFLIGRNGKVMFSSYGYNEDNLVKLEEVLKKIK